MSSNNFPYFHSSNLPKIDQIVVVKSVLGVRILVSWGQLQRENQKLKQSHFAKKTLWSTRRGELNARARASWLRRAPLAHTVLGSRFSPRERQWRRRRSRRPPARHDGCLRKWQESAHAIVSLRLHCLAPNNIYKNTHTHSGFRLMMRWAAVSKSPNECWRQRDECVSLSDGSSRGKIPFHFRLAHSGMTKRCQFSYTIYVRVSRQSKSQNIMFVFVMSSLSGWRRFLGMRLCALETETKFSRHDRIVSIKAKFVKFSLSRYVLYYCQQKKFR